MTFERDDDRDPLLELLDPAAGVGEADLALADLLTDMPHDGCDDAEALLVEEIGQLEGEALEAALGELSAPALDQLRAAFRSSAAKRLERKR